MLNRFLSVALCPSANAFRAWSAEGVVRRREESVSKPGCGSVYGGTKAPKAVEIKAVCFQFFLACEPGLAWPSQTPGISGKELEGRLRAWVHFYKLL